VMVDDAVLGEGAAAVAGHFFTEYAVMVVVRGLEYCCRWFVVGMVYSSCGGVAA
jgi:hypothetical protein